MSIHMPLLLLLMMTILSSAAVISNTSSIQCPTIANCRCSVPKAVICNSNGSLNLYQDVMTSLAMLPKGTVELLEIDLEDSSELKALRNVGNISLPRLVVTSRIGLRSVDEGAFRGLQDELKHLSLSNNKLKEVPRTALKDLTNLQTLDLQQNDIARLRAEDFKSLTNLSHIDLSNNSITGIESNAFRNLYKLQELILSNNRLTKNNLAAFVDAPNLKELDVSSNRLEGNVDEELLPNLPNLEILRMERNNMKSIRSGSLAGCPQLRTLNLSHNYIDILEDGAFLLLSDLLILDLSHNAILSISCWSLQGLNDLQLLRLTGNSLRAISLDLVQPLKNIQELWLDSNDIAKVESGVVAVLSRNDIKRLKLKDNPFECDCSMLQFVEWLRNSTTLSQADRSSAVCATPIALVGATLASTKPQDLTCSDGEDILEELEEEGQIAEVNYEELMNKKMPKVPGLPASTGSIQLQKYDYRPSSGVVLTWRIAPGPSFTCDAIFIYESKQNLDGTEAEILLDSNPVKCNRESTGNGGISNTEDQWRTVDVSVPGSLDLQDGGLYRYCLVLTRSLGGTSDDVDFALGCSDTIQLYKHGQQVRTPDASTIKFLSSALSGNGELRLHVSVRTSAVDTAVGCSLGVAVLAQGSVIARRDAPCNVLVRLQGFVEGPYTVCVSLAGHSVPGPYARCASVIRATPEPILLKTPQQPRGASYGSGTLILLAALATLLVLIIILVTAFTVIRLMRRNRTMCHAYYVKLHSNNTTSL